MTLRLIEYLKNNQPEGKMNQPAIERLQQKSPGENLIQNLRTDFNLSSIVARTLSEHVEHHFAHQDGQRLKMGQMTYVAVSRDSPAGRALSDCERKAVTLTLYDVDDLVALKEGVAALRQLRILRMTEEAYDQGALLTHEDLACLLSSSLATMKRDVSELRQHGLTVPTRGQVKDIGKGVSHKRQIVQDYLAGYTFSEIERRQRHSISSIRRYLRDFVRIIRLQAKGFTVTEIRWVTGVSERLVEEYQALYKNCSPTNDRLQGLLADAEAIPETPAEIKRGRWLR
jgi:hypothetical protein